MAVIGINYDEGNKKNLGYKSVDISYSSLKKKKVFNSGDFVKDWYDCLKFIITNNILNEEPITYSSSVDHFIVDGAPFESAYLHIKNKVTELKYVDHTDKNYIYTQTDIYEEGIELFVKKGTKPTWEELRKICRDEKKNVKK